MDKRRFLKAIGMTSVASLLAAPFFARSSASSAFAQEGTSEGEQFATLKEQIANLKKELEEKIAKEIRDRVAADASLSNSFIGSVVAIPYDSIPDVPDGWHLCDGEAIPETPEYAKLRALGLTHFPDYRGAFLRGLDKGKGKDPDKERKISDPQESANKKHTHACDGAGKHNHAIDSQSGTFLQYTFSDWRVNLGPHGDRNHGTVPSSDPPRFNCSVVENHAHNIQKDADGCETESRPYNVAVNYIIKYK